MYEEKEYLGRLQREIEEEQIKHRMKKVKDANDRQFEYEVFVEKKKKDQEERLREKQKEKDYLTLDFKSDENLNNYKEYILKLNQNVDSNIQKHKDFMQVLDKKIEYPNEYFDSNKGKESPLKVTGKHISNESIHNTNNLYNPCYVNSNWSDITNRNYFSKNNNDTYLDYKLAQRDVLKYNKEILDQKDKIKNQHFDYIRNSREDIIKEFERRKNYEENLKKNYLEKQRNYKELLDIQIQDPLHKSDKSINSFSNKNIFTDVIDSRYSPYNPKQVNLGKSLIERNPILNPIPDYKYNKYLYGRNGSASISVANGRVLY